MALLEDSRLFLANALLHKLEEFLMKNPDSDVTKELVKELEVSHQRRIQQLRQRVQMMRNAIHDFDMVRLASIFQKSLKELFHFLAF